MPHFNVTCKSDDADSLSVDLIRKNAQVDADPSSSTEDGNGSFASSIVTNKDDSNFLATLRSDYENLPETLTISSRTIVEWSEIVEGALPRLRCLNFRNCMNLRFLSEGLQNISTLEKLILPLAYADIVRRLIGLHKIHHISEFLVDEF